MKLAYYLYCYYYSKIGRIINWLAPVFGKSIHTFQSYPVIYKLVSEICKLQNEDFDWRCPYGREKKKFEKHTQLWRLWGSCRNSSLTSPNLFIVR